MRNTSNDKATGEVGMSEYMNAADQYMNAADQYMNDKATAQVGMSKRDFWVGFLFGLLAGMLIANGILIALLTGGVK